ncbi:MAG: hypothetical protein IT429_13290 [Gemmataceae bacterium]|nr:hypothetical protein [Gemmataceae bacterium]
MYRRRLRRPREVAFGLDSFLDVVANVVGIIIRLILVAWVGARSYRALTDVPVPPPEVPSAAHKEPASLEPELARHRRELEQTRERLLEQLRRLQALRTDNGKTGGEVVLLSGRRAELERERNALERTLKDRQQSAAAVTRSLAALDERRRRLDEEIRALEKEPSKKVLRYRTPVSRPVHSEELHFECRAGRVTFIDVSAFLAEVKGGLQDRARELRSRWKVEAETSSIGPFRLRYLVERQRGILDGLGGLPDPDGSFRCSVTAWVVEPLADPRGEPAAAALASGSAFRQVVDGLLPEQAVVTFWVYEDSFPLYRSLRDYLYERGVEVAGRPLPADHPIASSRQGTVSRGQ